MGLARSCGNFIADVLLGGGCVGNRVVLCAIAEPASDMDRTLVRGPSPRSAGEASQGEFCYAFQL